MSLTVVRDRPDRRRAYGINAPLHVSVAGGERVRAAEWSHLSVVVPADALPPLDGGLVQVLLHVDYQGFGIDVPVRARLDETGEDPPGEGLSRLEFVDFDDRGREIVQRFVDDYVRGRAVPAGDALVTLDAPHEPIDIKPDPVPPTLRRRLRPFAMTGFYLLLGLATFGYLGVLIYAHLVRLEVRTAVVTRPIEVVRTNDDGTIASVYRGDGDRVTPGALIARLSDPKLDEAIARAEARLETAINETKRARKRVRIDEQRLRDYRVLWDAERRSIERDIDRLEKDWRRALGRFRRSEALWDENAKGSTSKWGHMLAPHAWAWVEGEWGGACRARLKPREVAEIAGWGVGAPQTLKERRKAEIVPCAAWVERYREVVRSRKQWREAREDAKRQGRIDRLSETRLFNGKEFVVDLDVALLSRDQAKAREAEARALLAALKAQRGRTALRSARGGRVVEVAVASELPVTKGQTVAVIERDVPPTIDAYLTQEEVGHVGLGDRAEVFLPALDAAFRGRVVRVDRTAGHRDDVTARHFWREDGARSALVRLALDLREGDPHVASGLPATVLFSRRSPDLLRRRAARDVASRWFEDGTEPSATELSTAGENAPTLDASQRDAAPQPYDRWRETLAVQNPAAPGSDRGASPSPALAPEPSVDAWLSPYLAPAPAPPARDAWLIAHERARAGRASGSMATEGADGSSAAADARDAWRAMVLYEPPVRRAPVPPLGAAPARPLNATPAPEAAAPVPLPRTRPNMRPGAPRP